LVVRQGAILTGIGLCFGLVAAVAVVKMLGSQLVGTMSANASSPTTYLGVALVLLVVANLASYIPARRAVAVDPVETLRYE
jgi:putative ABC transport system permease protein